MNTSEKCMKGAWQAILRGDYAERDRLCDRARLLIEAEKQAGAMQRVMAVDFYVTDRGVAFPTKLMAEKVGAIQ
jgi:hypothetical protein